MFGNSISIEKDKLLALINQIFLIEQKIGKLQVTTSISRNLERMKSDLRDSGFFIENPIGEKFSETRTDCEASIAGNSTENLVITEVIKPIIRMRQADSSFILQRAVVVVENRT